MLVVAAGRGLGAQTPNEALKGAVESGLAEGQVDSESSGGGGGVTGDSEGVMPWLNEAIHYMALLPIILCLCRNVL